MTGTELKCFPSTLSTEHEANSFDGLKTDSFVGIVQQSRETHGNVAMVDRRNVSAKETHQQGGVGAQFRRATFEVGKRRQQVSTGDPFVQVDGNQLNQ